MKRTRIFISLFVIALNFALTQEIHSVEFTGCPQDIKSRIVKQAAIDYCLSDGNSGTLTLVCKEWQETISDLKKDKLWQNTYTAFLIKENEITYQSFIKGQLIYSPKKGNDIIRMRISDLSNPLDGEFDLSKCENARNYLSIRTGYRSKQKAENKNKLEIWLTPKFLIEKNLKSTASHFQDIYAKWSDKAPVGIFWILGNEKNLRHFDYEITEDLDQLSEAHLYEKWESCDRTTMSAPGSYSKIWNYADKQELFRLDFSN